MFGHVSASDMMMDIDNDLSNAVIAAPCCIYITTVDYCPSDFDIKCC